MRFLTLCFLLLAPSLTYASIGVFTDVTGDTRIQRGDFYLAAAPGVEIEEDDILETGKNGSAQVEGRPWDSVQCANPATKRASQHS